MSADHPESSTPPMESPAAPGWSAVKDAGVAADKGRRRRMEDAHLLIDNFAGSASTAFFGVFDGHGGKTIADACVTSFPNILSNHLSKIDVSDLSNVEKATEFFNSVYAEVDESLKSVNPTAGACAVTALIKQIGDKKMLFIANAGDCRAILSRESGPERLTVDHKPSKPEEAKRILDSGGFISQERVNGMLGISRAIGDHCMKQWIISTPHVTVIELQPTDDLLILACDGIWDVISDEEAVTMLKEKIDEGATILSKLLAVEALKKGTQDNISVVIVKL